MDQNELIKYRGNYSVEELAQILNVNTTDVEAWEKTGEIDEAKLYLRFFFSSDIL